MARLTKEELILRRKRKVLHEIVNIAIATYPENPDRANCLVDAAEEVVTLFGDHPAQMRRIVTTYYTAKAAIRRET